jgi:hypothetical protein
MSSLFLSACQRISFPQYSKDDEIIATRRFSGPEDSSDLMITSAPRLSAAVRVRMNYECPP